MKKSLLVCIVVLLLGLLGCKEKEKDLYPSAEVVEGVILYGFVDEEGNPASDALYEEILRTFDQGYGVVQSEGRPMIIDQKGREVTKKTYQTILDIQHKRAIAQRDGKTYVVDLSNGEEIFGGYDYIRMKTENLYAVLEGQRWSYRGEKEEKKIDGPFDEAYPFGKDGAVVMKDGVVFRLSREGDMEELPYSHVVKIEDTPYFIAAGEKTSLLDMSGNILIEEMPGDLTELKDDRMVLFIRSGGKLKKGIYDIQGKELVPPVHDEIRILDRTYFLSGEEGAWKIYTMENQLLNQERYSSVNAKHREENGGFLCAIREGKTFFIDQEGKEIPGPTNGALSMEKDTHLVMVEKEYGKEYYKDDTLVFRVPIVQPLGQLKVTFVAEGERTYPFLIHPKVEKTINEKLKEYIDALAQTKTTTYGLDLMGDILYVRVMEEEDFPFMMNIANGMKIRLDDIFHMEELNAYLKEQMEKRHGDMEYGEILSFAYDRNLEVVFQGDNPIHEIFPYEELESMIKHQSGDFFKAKLAPKINY
ncbi:MAG: WG repeat-containing protein [Tissierellia bacterium]|nr:WG repeat-containing protein [Tissierellia bacterium]